MTEFLNSLDNNLRKQLDYYQQLAELEKDKQQALVQNEIQEIDRITAQEEKILFEVSHLENERLNWAGFFAKETGKKAEEITLADLEQTYPQLAEVHRELETVITELRELHETNTKLLQNAVKLVNFTMQALTNEKQTTYTKPTNKDGQTQSTLNLFDKSI